MTPRQPTSASQHLALAVISYEVSAPLNSLEVPSVSQHLKNLKEVEQICFEPDAESPYRSGLLAQSQQGLERVKWVKLC